MLPQPQIQSTTKIIPVETGHKIQIPPEWAAEFGLENVATLEKTATGILVRPHRTLTWDEVFADKLQMGQYVFALDLSEVSGDDFLL